MMQRSLTILGLTATIVLSAPALAQSSAPTTVGPTVTRDAMQGKSDAIRAQAEAERRQREDADRREAKDEKPATPPPAGAGGTTAPPSQAK